MRKILLATDGSDASIKAGRTAASLLEAYPESQLTVLHVLKPIYMGDGMGLADSAGYDAMEIYAEELKQEAIREFRRFEGRVQFLSQYGSPAIVICDAADQVEADLVVVGSHGRGMVDRLLLGSVSQGVSHRAKMSVLIVK